MLKSKNILPFILIFTALAAFAYAAEQPQTAPPKDAPPQIVLLRWVSLSTDSPDTVREIIRSEVDNREGFSTTREEKANLKAVEDEKERDDSDYKNSIISSKKQKKKSSF